MKIDFGKGKAECEKVRKKIMRINTKVRSEDIIFYNKCQCGAITIETEAGTYSCKSSVFRILFPNVDLRKCKSVKGPQEWSNCNHCVNKYGLDLCSCGSGEKAGKCACGSTKPMQVYGEYERINGDNALLAF